MNEEKFTKYYLGCISEKYPEVDYEILDSLMLKATTKEDKEVFHDLDNAFREYNREPKELKEIIERYMESSEGSYHLEDGIDVNRIVPMIKSRDYIEQVDHLREEIKAKKKTDLVWESYNKELIIVFAEDREKSISYINREDFEKLGVEKNKLRELAVRNLSGIIPEIQSSETDGIYMLIAGGNYEASLILLKDIWTSENFQVDGEILIAIPNRDLVLITGSKNNLHIQKLEMIVEESYNNGNHSITPRLFIFTGEAFTGI